MKAAHRNLLVFAVLGSLVLSVSAEAVTPVLIDPEQKISNLSGSLGNVLAAGDLFGSAVTEIGDIDGDTVMDYAVGAEGTDSAAGAVWILLMNADGSVKSSVQIDGSSAVLTGALDADDEFGTSVAGIGDFDGDGVRDIAVGAANDDDKDDNNDQVDDGGGINRGAAYIILLNNDGTPKEAHKISSLTVGLTIPNDSDQFGDDLASLGDIDGGGGSELTLAVGAPGDRDGDTAPSFLRGAVYILFLTYNNGSSSVTIDAVQKLSDTAGTPGGFTLGNSDLFGSSVGTLEDLDGNGIRELVVGAPLDDDNDDGDASLGANRGAVYVLFLNSGGSATAFSKISETTGGFGGELDQSDFFGDAVDGLSDLDGDGNPELAVGASGDDDGDSGAGAVWLCFLDYTGGVVSVRAELKISDTAGDFDAVLDADDMFGTSLAVVSDRNDDGHPELLIGAQGDDDGGGSAGAAHIANIAPATLEALKTDILVADTDIIGVPDPGDTVEYCISIHNLGYVKADNVLFVDVFDQNAPPIPGSVTTTRGVVSVNGDSIIVSGVGTLTPQSTNPGADDSLKVTFQVAIEDPYPAQSTSISNQGFIQSDNLPAEIPTDDPDTGTADDPTVFIVDAAPSITADKIDSLLVDTDLSGDVSPGDTLRYTVTVENQGDQVAGPNTTFTDAPDANTALVVGSVTASAGTILSGNAAGDAGVEVAIGEIQAEGAETITITFDVVVDDPLAAGVIQVSNQGTVSGDNFANVLTDDPDVGGGADPTVTPIVLPPPMEPDIAATKGDALLVDIDGDNDADPGDTIRYTITMVNTGNEDSQNTVFTDTPDPNTSLVVGSVTTSAGSIVSGNTAGDTSVQVNIGLIQDEGAETVTITFDVLVNGTLPSGVESISNQGTVSGDNFTDVPTDDPDTPTAADPTVTPVVAAPDLVVLKDDGGITPAPGDTLTYGVTVQNAGDQDATGVVLTETVPANTTFLPGESAAGWVCVPDNSAGSTCTFNLGALAGDGSSVVVTFAVEIDNPVAGGTDAIENTASATDDGSNGADPNPGDNEVVVNTPVDAMPMLSVSKIDVFLNDGDGDGEANPGETVQYFILVTNLGNEDAISVVFTDVAGDHPGATLVDGSVTTTQGTVTSGNGGGETDVAVDLGTLAAGGGLEVISFAVVIDDPFPGGQSQLCNQGTFSGGNFPDVVTDDPADATGDADPTCIEVIANLPPVITDIDPETQEVQYSDAIQPITVVAEDDGRPTATLSLTTNWWVDGGPSTPGLPPDLSVIGVACSTDPSGEQECSWTLAGQMLECAGILHVEVIVEDGELASDPDTLTIEVKPEDAVATFTDTNPVAVEVDTPGGDSPPFTICVEVMEYDDPDDVLGDDNLAGDLSLASIAVRLVPVGPGGTQNPIGPCSDVLGAGLADPDSPFDYDVRTLTCTFDNVPVNTYAVEVDINLDGCYEGLSEDVLTVFDPSLGFTTGGGWFYWPGTAGSAYPGDKTNFGFNIDYNKKGNKTKGSLLVIRHLADGSSARLKSNALEGLAVGEGVEPGGDTFGWASFSGKATYRAIGWPEPIGNHRFVAYVEDHGTPGAGADRFWVEVKNSDGDVQPDLTLADPAPANAELIEGGNIVVPHKPKRGRNKNASQWMEMVDVPSVYGLGQNFPNPFRAGTVIRFDLPEPSHVRLSVFDIAGREVARVVDRQMPAGYHQTAWDAGSLAKGIYFYRISAGSYVETRRMVVLR